MLAGFIAASVGVAEAAIPTSERQALIDVYNATSGPTWANNAGWLGDVGSECSWYGVQCDADESHVEVLSLVGNNLVGEMPDISGLGFTKRLVITNNKQLTGEIPNLSEFSRAAFISFYNNGFTGEIPNLSSLVSAEVLIFSQNYLSGGVPDLSNLTSLQRFIAKYNALDGRLPESNKLPASNVSKSLYLSFNKLTGGVPDYSSIPNVEIMDLTGNSLDGGLPPGTYISTVKTFLAGCNFFTGSIPDPFAGEETRAYKVPGNHLSGVLPEMNSYPKLEYFGVWFNHIGGTIPSFETVGVESEFYPPTFDLNHNRFSGLPPRLPPNFAQGRPGEGYSDICANDIAPIPDADWNLATGVAPWYENSRYGEGQCTGQDTIFSAGLDGLDWAEIDSMCSSVHPDAGGVLDTAGGGPQIGASAMELDPATGDMTVVQWR